MGTMGWRTLGLFFCLTVSAAAAADADKVDEAALLKAATLYASFDEAPKADFGGGELTLRTRFNHETEKGKFVIEKGISDKAFRVAPGKGIQGGALECTDVLPRNGRIFFPAKGNIAFKKGGWGGSVSVWINTDPNTLLKTQFCDPVQITQKGANNGGIWFDFNDAKPRDLRLGTFPAVGPGQKAIPESDPNAPMVRVKNVGFKAGDWHHVVLTWNNFDTGKNDAISALYIDGKRIGEVTNFIIPMDWDIDQAGIYIAVSYIGLLDEFAIFNRPLTAAEVTHLHKQPGALAALKKKAAPKKPGQGRLPDFEKRINAVKPTETDALRKELLSYLETREGREQAESGLQLLLRLPPRSTAPPPAPKFPFDAKAARGYQQAFAHWLGLPLEFVNGQGMTFVLVPPGTFRMGSPADEPGHNSGGYDESPHPVTLTRPFYLSKHETTVGQFRRFVSATNYVTDIERTGGGNAHDAKAVWQHRPGTTWLKPGYAAPFTLRDEHPVVHVSHTDAGAFCRWLQEQSGAAAGPGWKYDLPSEAQWEWACRAGSGARFWWGADEDTSGKVINAGDHTLKQVHPDWPRIVMPMNDGHAFLAPVGSYQANGFGLHDMLGNVWEFCSTHYGPYPKEAITDPGDGDLKRGFAVRGGGWSNTPNDCRCASRNADPPHFGHSNLGFRVAWLIPNR